MVHENIIVSGSLIVVNGLQIPTGTVQSRLSLPDTGSLFFQTSTSGSQVLVFTGTPSGSLEGWEVVGEQQNVSPAFLYRNIISYGYLAGGYKSSSPWKTVHKTVAATDQTSNIGELLDYPVSYTSGVPNDSILFVFSSNSDNAWKSATDVHGTYTSAINLVNETGYAHQSKWDLANARADVGVVHKETQYAWIFAGGNATVEKFDLSNETMTATTFTSFNSTLGASGFSDENYGYPYGSESGVKLTFSTDTPVASTHWGVSGQQKGISSKLGKGYCGNEGTYNGGYNLRRWMTATDTNAGNVAKPHPNCGEENFTMGQDWQYMLGVYDGTGQTNTSWKLTYATDTGIVNPAGLAPGTNPGASSGVGGWRA